MGKRYYIRLFLVCALSVLFIMSGSHSSMAYEKEINILSQSIAEKIAGAGKKRIAVIDFTDLHGNVTELGRFFAEEFSVALVETGVGFEVVDRNNIKIILAEHEIFSTGTIDLQIAKKLYQIAGVDALITGTITSFSDSIRISIKILDTATAKIMSASRGNIAMTKEIEELLDRRVGPDQSQAQQLAAVDTLQKAPVGRNQLLRTLGLQHLSTDIMQPEPGMASQKVGDLDITIKKITILPEGKIKVKLGFFNHSYQQFLGAQHRPLPSLTDDKGNIFKFEGGLAIVYSNDWSQGWRNGLDLPNQANRDGVLHFISANKDINFEEIGSHFAFSLHYLLYNPKLSKITFHTVSFTDIITQE